MKKAFAKVKKILTISLIFTLVIGIAASAFGISVTALSREKTSTQTEDNEASQQSEDTSVTQTTTSEEPIYENPTDDYSDFSNEVTVNNTVNILTQEESKEINKSIISVEDTTDYDGDKQLIVTLNSEEINALDDISNGDIIYLDGNAATTFGEARFFKIDDYDTYTGQTVLYVSEPCIDEVFETMEICTSDILSEENFVEAQYLEGVSAEFGELDETEILNVSQTVTLGDETAQELAASNEEIKPTPLATEISTPSKDLIVEFDVDLLNLKDKVIKTSTDPKKMKSKKKDTKNEKLTGKFELKGQVGIKDLAAHLVCDKDGILSFEDFYVGVSGQFVAGVDIVGGVDYKTEADESKKEWKYLSLEGLSNKRFPIAVFKFQGTTPIYITNSAFEKGRESVVPKMYLILYSDWEGKISLQVNAGFTYGHSFNSGLRVIKDGEPCFQFEEYPYTPSYDTENEDGVIWNVELEFEASADITVFGAGLVFYVAGINICDISVAKVGLETEAAAKIKASYQDKEIETEAEASFYIRAYLKLIDLKVKLKAEGEKFLDFLSVDLDIQFNLIDITLFEIGEQPDKYRPLKPVSTMPPPTEFNSVISVVFDVSGSMSSAIDTGESKLEAAKQASKTILTTASGWNKNGDDGAFGIGLVEFESDATVVSVPHIDFDYLSDCVDTLSSNGGTDIRDGVEAAVSQLSAVNATNKAIILMTDGQDNNGTSSDTIAKLATDKGIKIFTVGFGSDVDTSYLTEIATITGGEYRYADTSNIMGIVGSFMYAQAATTSEVLKDHTGTINEGQTIKIGSFYVEDANGRLLSSTAWPGSFLDTILIDPTGRIVDEDYPGAIIDESTIPTTIIVTNPIKGEWELEIEGIETSYPDEPFYTIVSFEAEANALVADPITTMQLVAAYCIPIGILTTIFSAMMLLCLIKKKETKAEVTNEEVTTE